MGILHFNQTSCYIFSGGEELLDETD